MATLSWLTAFALLSVAAPEGPSNPSPAKESLPPTQRAEDHPAHESPYSAFGAPKAKRTPSKKRSGARLHCNDGTIQTQGQQKDKGACDDHGGVKAKSKP